MADGGKNQFRGQLIIALIGFTGLVGSALINSSGRFFSARNSQQPSPSTINSSQAALPPETLQCDGTDLTLLEAAQAGDLQQVTALLNCGSDPNELSTWEQSIPDSFETLTLAAPPIHAATWNGHINIVETLISVGADVNATDQGGYSPLMIAAQTNDIEMIDLFLAFGADIDYAADCATCEQETALILAAENGNAETVEQLLLEGADKQKTLQSGQNALDLAKQEDYTDIVELLQAE